MYEVITDPANSEIYQVVSRPDDMDMEANNKTYDSTVTNINK